MSDTTRKSKETSVLFLHNRPSGGGGESLFQMLYGNLKWKTKAIVFLTDGFLREKFRLLEPDIEVIIQVGSSWLGTIKNKKWLYIPTRLWDLKRSRMFYRRVLGLIRKHGINIIHSNTMNMMVGGYIARRMGLVHLVQVRELVDLPYYQFPIPKKWALRVVSKYSDAVVANSERTKQALESLSVPREKIRVIYNTVSKPEEHLDIREIVGLSKDTKVVAIVGWITPNKMVEDFLSIAKRFEHREDIAFLVVGGEGGNSDYNQMINSQAKTLKNVLFTGIIKNATSYMSSFDVLICTCYTESFGRTVAEALIVGTPSIGVKECAVGELIKQNKTGFLTNKSNIDAFAEYTDKLINSKELRKEMGKAAIEDMESRFGLQVIRRQYSELYQELLNKNEKW